jgi:hypothetical protein
MTQHSALRFRFVLPGARRCIGYVDWTNDTVLLPVDSLYDLQFYGVSIDISKIQNLAMGCATLAEDPDYSKLVHKFASSCLKLKNLDLLLGGKLSYYLKEVPSYSGYILPINGQMSDMYLRALSMQNSTTRTDRQRREKARGYQRTADRIRAEMQDIAASKEDENWKNINFNVSLLALIHGGYRLDEENNLWFVPKENPTLLSIYDPDLWTFMRINYMECETRCFPDGSLYQQYEYEGVERLFMED